MAAVLGWGLLVPSPAQAQEPRAHQLKYDIGLDATVIGVSAAFVIGTELFKVVKPQRCRWCDRDHGEDRLNALDRWGREHGKWQNEGAAQFGSGVTTFLLEPAVATVDMIAAAAVDNADRAFPVDVLIIAEAVAVSTALNQAAKLVFARERPFVHAMPAEERNKVALPSDNYVSFYSGHTAMAFSLAAAAGTVATLRDYRLMPLVWGTLVPLAFVGGYLRIAADKHYVTDVLTGAVLGTAVGVLLPVLFHPRRGGDRVPIGSGDTPLGGSGQLPVRGATTPMVTLGGAF